MKRRDLLKLSMAATPLGLGLSRAVSAPAAASYLPGVRMHRDVAVLNADRTRVKLLELCDDGTKLLVLLFIGSAFPGDTARRLGIWCEDSADDMALQRALFLTYGAAGVRFVPIVCPPVYSEKNYGFPEGVFLGRPDDDPQFQQAVSQVISKTEELRDKNFLPFSELYYDPRFVLLRNASVELPYAALPMKEAWLGKFKWKADTRKYGTPTIWVLDRSGTVLSEPFWGNEYDTAPAVIRYTYRDVASELDTLLRRARRT